MRQSIHWVVRETTSVGHSGIEPETSELSALRANQLCQCPLLRIYRNVLIKLQMRSHECPSHLFATLFITSNSI